ncbi:hypothetical protein BGZ57DRAFT_932909 [Hyaloscypha finlandica]|nr:hypothetical protein BGZ57DRAFT_932909 [Hyaloscypha finlandica]
MMGDLLVRPLTAIPNDIHPWESQSIDSFKELTSNIGTRNPNLHLPSEMPADSTPHDSFHNCAPQVPEKVQHQPRSGEMPPQTFTFSQVPQALDSLTSSLLTSHTSAPPKARSFSEGTPTSSQAAGRLNISYTTNINRQKTKKWVDAKPGNYGGEGWGDDLDHYHDPVHFREQKPQPLAQSRPQTASESQEQSYPQVWNPNPNQQEYQTHLPEIPLPLPNPPAQQYQPYRPLSLPEIPLPLPNPLLQQYQPYGPPLPPRTPLDPGGGVLPDLSMQQQQQQPLSTLVSPPTEPSTPAQSAISPTISEIQNPPARSATLGETRRRNQRALLALMSRASDE